MMRRLGCKNPRQGDARPLAAGERRDRPLGVLGDTGCRQRAGDGSAIRGGEIGAGATRQPAEGNDVGDRHRPVEDVALRQVGDAPGALGERQAREMRRIDGEVAACRNEAGDGAEQRRLARAIRPDDGDELAVPHVRSMPASTGLPPRLTVARVMDKAVAAAFTAPLRSAHGADA